MTYIFNQLKKHFIKVITGFATFWSLGGFISDAWEGVKDAASSLAETAIAPATSAASAITGGAQKLWNDFNGITAAEKAAQQAERNTKAQLAWERERAQNAHQWEVADLEAAGLNKVLTANGSGAQTAPITPQATDWSGYGSGWGKALGLISPITGALSTAKQARAAELASAAKSTLDYAQAGAITAEWMPGGIKHQILNQIKAQIKETNSQTHLNTVTAKYTATKAVDTLTDIAYKEVETAIKNKDLKYYEFGATMNYIGKHVIPLVMMYNGAGIAKGALSNIMKNETRKAIKIMSNKGAVPRRGGYIEDINPFYHARKNPYKRKL